MDVFSDSKEKKFWESWSCVQTPCFISLTVLLETAYALRWIVLWGSVAFLVGHLKQVLILKKFCSFHSAPCKKQKWHPSGSLSTTVEMTRSMPLFKKMWEGFCIQSGIAYSPTSSPMKEGWDRICQVLCHSTAPCKSALNSIKRRDHRWASFHFRSQDPLHIKLSVIPIDTLGGGKLMTCIWDIGFIHVYKFTVPNLSERQACVVSFVCKQYCTSVLQTKSRENSVLYIHGV